MVNGCSDNRLVSFWREIETSIYTNWTNSTSSCPTEAKNKQFLSFI